MRKITSKAEVRRERITERQGRQRRVRLNQANGMTAHCPWAWQLSAEEVEAMERLLREGRSLPPPIWTDGGLQMLADPFRIAQRAQAAQIRGDGGNRRRYIEGKYANCIQH